MLFCCHYRILFSWKLLDMILLYYALYYIEFPLTSSFRSSSYTYRYTWPTKNFQLPFPLFIIFSFLWKSEKFYWKARKFKTGPFLHWGFFAVFSFSPKNNLWYLPKGPFRFYLVFLLQKFSKQFFNNIFLIFLRFSCYFCCCWIFEVFSRLLLF